MGFTQKVYAEELALQKKLLEKLKDVKEVTDDSLEARFTLLRFLRSVNYDLKKAEASLRKYNEFKTERNLHGIGAHPLDKTMYSLAPLDAVMKDSQGRPVTYTLAKCWNPEGIMNYINGDIKKFENYSFHIFERCCHQLIEFNAKRPKGSPLITDFCHVFDYEDFGLSNFMSTKALKVFSCIANVYKVYFLDLAISHHINCPTYFGPVKALTGGDPAKTMFITKRSVWEPELRKHLDFAELERDHMMRLRNSYAKGG